MYCKLSISCLLTLLVIVSACRSPYQVVGIERTRIIMDSTYETYPDAAAEAFMKPYKHVIDSIMEPVVGHSAKYMTADRPEGTLSNLLADIMVWASKDYKEKVDFGVYNMGGVRADLPKGDVTFGDVLDIAPFENKIAFITLSGDDVMELFREMASVGGEGVSQSVRLVINRKLQLLSATISGQSIDPSRNYRIATIDYLLEGNDRMLAFRKGSNINSPQEAKNNTRFIIMDYFREQTRLGKVINAEIEGRITVKE